MLRASSSQIGPFRLLKSRGRGGMGEVFEAVNELTGQRVAVKLLSHEASREPQLVARFLNEGRTLVNLDVPGVVRAFHCAKQADQVYLVMELLEGMSLREWMERHSGPVPRASALAWCAQVARTMAEVHSKKVVHRDLKPENVFLCTDASEALGFRAKVLDFGIAKVSLVRGDGLVATQILTHEGALIGTYHYTAPEQLRSASEVDGAADVYSLGVMLFELLAGRRPFVSDEMIDVISGHVNEPAPPLSRFVPSIPGALATFVASMLAKLPEERPSMARCRDMLSRPWAQEQDLCPVPGLAPFSEAQAELFFGRKAETRRVLEYLDEARAGGRRWVSMEGPSGVGKSSLLRAGVLPRLGESPPTGLPRWMVAVARPSFEPVRSLARALVAVFPTLDAAEVERGLLSGPGGLHAFVQAHVPEDTLLLLVVEPLEELFTSGAAEQKVLDALLGASLSVEDGRLRLMTCLRSDFLHRLEQLPRLSRLLQGAARFPLLPMDEVALKEVVDGMARHAGLSLSEGLAERMVRDAKGEGGGLPLLGHALRSLWTLSGGAPLTHEHYDRMGGVGGALSQQAEQLLESLGEQGRERARWLLLSLVQVGRGVQDTRRPRSRSEVLVEAGGDELAEAVLLRLSGSLDAKEGEPGPRLVLVSGGPEVASQRVDLVHETLLQRVRSLVTWLEEDRRRLEVLADLESAARLWEEAEHPQDRLPQGTLLAHYREGVTPSGRGTRRVSPRAEQFLLAASRLERRLEWTRNARVFSAALVVVVMLGVTLHARREQARAHRNLAHAMSIIEEFVSGADWELSWLPNTLKIRRTLLSNLVAPLRRLPPEELRVREVLWGRIKMEHRIADMNLVNDSLRMASLHLGAARALLEVGEELGFEDADSRREWAFHFSKQGKVEMAAGRLGLARAFFLKSIASLEAPRAASPRTVDGDRASAVSMSEMAEVELAEGRPEVAIGWFEQALGLFSKTDPEYDGAIFAQALAHQAEAMRRAGRIEEARPRMDEAVRLAESSARMRSEDHHRRWILAWVRHWDARLLVDEGRLKEAESRYAEVMKLGRSLLNGESTSKRFALVLLESLHEREALARRQANASAAATWLRVRCALVSDFLRRDPGDVRFRALACEADEP